MKKIILSFVAISFLLVGCSDYVEVENLTIVTAVTIDIDDENQGYKISLEVVKFIDDTTNVSIIEAVGATFPQAITNAIKITGNDLYFSHAQAIIISEDVAKTSIYPLIDYAYRNTDFRLNITMLVAKDVTASEILQANSLIDDIAGVQIKKIVDSNELISEVPSMPIYEFIDDVSTAGICGILPTVSITTDQNDNLIREISGLALFDKDVLYGFLDEKQTKTLSTMLNKAQTGSVIDEYDENTPTFNLVSAKTEISPKNQNGQVEFEFTVKMEIELVEQTDGLDTQNYKNQLDAQKSITEAVKKDIDQLIQYQKSNRSTDFLGLGNMVYRKYPDLWLDIEPNYQQFLGNFSYTLNVECEIVGTGLVSSPMIIER